MTEQATPCDLERLRQLLVCELPASMEAETAQHLAGCSQCQRQLETLAGNDQWWHEVKACCSQHAELIANRQPSARCLEQSDESKHSSPADFAVDFLEPSENVDALGQLDNIEILEVIGRGGMGIVLKGRQRDLSRHVAVKVMAPHLAASGSARRRFAREARAAAAVVHPHVMAIHMVNAVGRLPYLVMPYVASESLQQRLDRDGPLELIEILRIGHQVAAGLAAAHAQGLVHRDVKPANILLEKGVDRVMLTDFGLARAVDDASLTRSGVIAGTPQFMSPEQARGESIDVRSDLFSIGSVLYCMCTGRPPFRSETSLGVLRRITDNQPREIRELNPEMPQWLTAIVDQLHAKDRNRRLQSAQELADLLEKCLSHAQQPTNVPLPPPVLAALPQVPDRRSPAANRLVRIAVGCAAIVAIASGGFYWLAGDDNQTTQPQERSLSSDAWNDEIPVQIQNLQIEIDQLESQTSRDWDAVQIPDFDGPSQQDINPILDQEIRREI